MTSPPPPPSDGPKIPPRHRPTLQNLTKDSTELDLWAFEDDLDLGEAPEPQTPRGAPEAEIPLPRKTWSGKAKAVPQPSESDPTPLPAARDERVRINVSKGRLKNQPAGPMAGLPKADLDLDDLELWGDVSTESELGELPTAETPVETTEPEPAAKPEPAAEASAEEAAAAIVEPLGHPETPDATTPEIPSAAEEIPFAPEVEGQPPATESDAPPIVAPVSLRPRMNLNSTERIGMIALLIVLAGLGIAALMLTLGRLPTESAHARENDFPIRGEFITVKSASNYWREPIRDGVAPDTVRRGTRLLPELEIEVSEGTGALRVLFRNEDRLVVGDAVTRAVRGGGKLLIPATAGFEDLGMHAAYRTGQSRPWTIEVFEAASQDVTGREFKKLFELNISTDRR